MDINEYRQLSAFARYDGIYLAVIWTASFACLIFTPTYPIASMPCMLLALSTPFFVGYRLWKFRREGRDDQISFKQALLYCFRLFLNAAMVFAIIQWAYMQFLDHGNLSSLLQMAINTPDSMAMMKQAGYDEALINQAIAEINNMTPMTFAATYFVNNIIIGCILSIPIAAMMKKELSNKELRSKE